MLAPTDHLLKELYPPGSSMAIAIVTGALVGLALIPIATIALTPTLLLVGWSRLRRAAARWIDGRRAQRSAAE